MSNDARALAAGGRQAGPWVAASEGEGSGEPTDGSHVSGRPGTTLGVTVGHAAQGDTDQPGTKQASDKPAGDSKLGWSEEAEEDQRLHLLGEQECGASSGWRVRDGDRQLHKRHTSPAKISRGTQQRCGLETGQP